MAFDPEPTRKPESIGNVVITLKDGFTTNDDGILVAYQSASFNIDVILDDGSKARRAGNLAPHITAGQRQALMDFMTGLRTQAEQQILPPTTSTSTSTSSTTSTSTSTSSSTSLSTTTTVL